MRSEKRPVQAASQNIPNPDARERTPPLRIVKETPGVEHAIATAIAQELAARAPGVDLEALAREISNQAFAR